MSISNPNPQPNDVVLFQRDASNTYWGEVHISGSNLIMYVDSNGFVNADHSSSFYNVFPPPANSGGGTNLITGSTYPITASNAITASFALNGNSGTTLTTGSNYPVTTSWANNSISSAFATSASWAPTPVSVSFAQNAFSASHSNNSDNSISSSWAPTQISISFAQNAFSASHANNSDNAISSSFATNASLATTASAATSITFVPSTSSFSVTSSFSIKSLNSDNSISSSISQTASYVKNAETSSFALTASNFNGNKITASLNTSYIGFQNTASFINGYLLSGQVTDSPSDSNVFVEFQIADGFGGFNRTLYVDNDSVQIAGEIDCGDILASTGFFSNDVNVTNVLNAPQITGSLFGTSSVSISSSFTSTSSFAQIAKSASISNTASYLLPVANLSASMISGSLINISGLAVNNLGQLSVQSNGVFPNNTFYSAQFGNAIDIEGASAGFQIADRTNNAHKWQHYALNDFFRIWNSTGNEFFVMNYNTGKVGLNLATGSVVNQLDVGGNISASVVTASLFFGTSSWSNNTIAAKTASALTNGSPVSGTLVFPDSTGDVLLYNSNASLIISSSNGVVAAGNGVCYADFGFQTLGAGGEGFYDAHQTPGRVTVWEASNPFLSSSIITVTELETLHGISSSVQLQINNLKFQNSSSLTASYVSSSGNVILQSGTNTVELFNTNSAQRLNIYNSFTDASNFKRLSLYGSAGDYVIEANATGSGTSGGDLYIKHSAGSHSIRIWTANIERYRIENNGDFVPASSNTYNLGTSGLLFSNVYSTRFTGSLFGNASTATSASFASQSLSSSWAPVQVSASFANTASFAQSISGSVTSIGNLLSSGIITSHNATASNGNGVVVYADNALAIALSVGGNNSNLIYDNNGGFSIQPTSRANVITGISPGTVAFRIFSGSNDASFSNRLSINGASQVNSLDVLGNISASIITASLFNGTASFALNGGSGTTLFTASTYPITSSWTISASYSRNSDNSISASKAQSASFATNAISSSFSNISISSSFASTAGAINFIPATASFATTAGVANSINFVPSTAVSSSFASQSISSSYSQTASNALYAKTSFVDDINSGLIVYLPFDEGSGSVVHNYSSVNVDATKFEIANGQPQVATGSGWNTNSKRGGFSQLLTPNTNTVGSASYVEFNNSTIAAGLPSMSFAIWYQSSGSTVGINNGRIVTKFNGGTSGEFSYTLTNVNQLGVILVNSLNQRLDQTVNTPKLNDNKWHHIVGTFNGVTSSVYVDGQLCGATPFTGSLQNSAFKLRVGTFENLGLSPLCGYVDEFKLWGRTLTPNEILYLYNDGNLENSFYTDANGNSMISGSVNFLGSITGSLQGSASFATTSSNAVTASFAITASFARTASFATTSSNATTASFAISASWAPTNLITASTYQITSSWANNARTASFFSGSVSNANTASLSLIANKLVSGSGNIIWDNGNSIWVTNAALEVQGGIYDGANAIIAATFDDQHALNDTGESTMIDFSSLGFGSMFGNWSVFNGGITSSLFGTASAARNATSSSFATTASFALTAKTASSLVTTNQYSVSNLTSSNGVSLGNGSSFGLASFYDVVNGQYYNIAAEDGGIAVSPNAVLDVGGDLSVAGTTIVGDINASGTVTVTQVIIGNLRGTANTASYVSSSKNVTIQSALNTTEFKNSSSAQTVNIYGSGSSATSFNRLAIYHNAVNGMTIESQPQGSASSSGDFIISHAANHSIKFFTNGSNKWTIGSNGDLLPAGTTFNIAQNGQAVNNLWVRNINGQAITGSLTGSFGGQLSVDRQMTIKGDLDDIYLFNTQSALFVTNSGSGVTVGMGNGVCVADNGFQTAAAFGFVDINQATGTVAVWNTAIPNISSSNVLIAELGTLKGINTGSTIQAQINRAITPVTWSAISAATNVTWSAAANVYQDRRNIVVTGPTTMSIQNLYNGWEGSLKVTNGNTGSLLFITPTPKVMNGGSGSISLTNISASVDFIGFQYDGTLYASVGNTFN